MAYLASYRQYRPLTFKNVIGQDHITQTLQNQILRGQISHAYLFAGSRGTGKTSVAKIFARAINCLDTKNAPCGECATCKALNDPSNLDILEIDAASNNRVDEIRELREKVKYPPISGKYKVYIIDEVHMLTDSAFNALLKTLEEPPAHAVFILATTEVQKLPPTILSRCMRFDFKLVSEQKLAEHLSGILKDMKVAYEPEAVKLIASAGQGSVRDMLSIADMCISYSAQKITYNSVLEVLGAVSKDVLVSLADSIMSNGVGDILTKINAIAMSGKNMGVLCRDLAQYFRDLMVLKVCANPNSILALPTEVMLPMQHSASLATFDDLNMCMQIFSGTDQDLKYSLNPRIMLETACIKAATNIKNPSGDVFKKKITTDNIIDVKESKPTKQDLKASGEHSLSISAEELQSLTPKEFIPDEDINVASTLAPEIVEEENASSKIIENATELPAKSNESLAKKEAFEFEKYDLNVARNQNLEEKTENKVSPRKVWGQVLLNLRKQGLIILHSACGEITEVEINDKDFIIYVYDELIWEVLQKPINYAQLTQVLKDSGYEYNISIIKKDKQADKTKQIIENLTKKIGDILKVED